MNNLRNAYFALCLGLSVGAGTVGYRIGSSGQKKLDTQAAVQAVLNKHIPGNGKAGPLYIIGASEPKKAHLRSFSYPQSDDDNISLDLLLEALAADKSSARENPKVAQ